MRAPQIVARAGAALPRGKTLSGDEWTVRHGWMLRVLMAHAVLFAVWGTIKRASPFELVVSINPILMCAAVALIPTLSRRIRAAAVCFGLLTSSALVVHFMDGAIEGHFHFFVMVTLLALYEEWFPYLLSFAYVLAHHGIVGALVPADVFNHHNAIAYPWKWAAIHALFIAGLGVVNLIKWRLNESARAETAASEGQFRSAFDDAPTAMAIVELDGTVRRVNDAMCHRTGFTAEEFAGVPLSDLLVGDDRDGVRFPDIDAGEVELRYRCRDGSHGWGLWHHSAICDGAGTVVAYVSHCVDMTKRKQAEARLSFRANHDLLTRLPNRELFTRHLEDALRQRTDGSGEVAVLFVDLDNFKLVNDSLGHEYGDRVLTAVAARLRKLLRPYDIVARFGGDEFVILLSGISGKPDAVRVAERVGEAMRAPFDLDGEPRFIGASVGVRMYEAGDSLDPGRMVRDADTAMYRAKELGRGRLEVFDDEMGDAAVQRLEIETSLRSALELGQLRLAFQPVVALDDRSLIGVEALLRWSHPTHGLIPPMAFIPAAERNGLIVPIGEWVLRESCRQLAEWGDDQLTMSVNVSVKQLASPSFLPAIRDALERAGVEPHRLCLEITETATMEDFELLTRTVTAIKEMGVRIAIDDFGTGYASLRNLRTRLPIDVVKIDRSFISGIASDLGDATIVEGVLSLARALGLEVVAEGVETIEQASRLQEWRCSLAQGYLYARPVDADAISAMLSGGGIAQRNAVLAAPGVA